MGCLGKVYSIVILLILTVPQKGTCLPNGAPVEACSTLMPQHSGTAPQPSDTSPYRLVAGDTYTPGITVAVRLVVSDPRYFLRGLILQARRGDDGTPFGSWQVPLGEKPIWKYLTCPDAQYREATITHFEDTDKYVTENSFITWNAPLLETNPNTVDFIGSVVHNFTTYWVNLQASVVRQQPVGNECESNPCLNGGTCYGLLNGFRCECQGGFTGGRCDIVSNFVPACNSNPCLNDGRCFSSVNRTSYICQCLPQFTGTHCESADRVPPVFRDCPQEISQSIPFGQTTTSVQWIAPTATDNSGILPPVSNPQYFPGQQLSVGRYTVTYSAQDTADNVALCSFNIIITQEGPTATPPTQCIVPCLNGGTCVEGSQTFPCLCPVGFDGRNCEEDRTPPVVECPPSLDFEVYLGQEGRRVNWSDPIVSDNSGEFRLVENSHSPNDFFQVGVAVVMYTYQDLANNMNTCSFQVSIVAVVSPNQCAPNPCLNGGTCLVGVIATCLCAEGFTGLTCEVDSAPPEVQCPADLTVQVGVGQGGLYTYVNWTAPNVTDNSGNFTQISNSHNPGDFFEEGGTVVTYVYGDANGNRKSCIFTITIVEEIQANQCNPSPCQNRGTCLNGPDFTCLCNRGFAGPRCEVDRSPPVVTCPPDIFKDVPLGMDSKTVEWMAPRVTDNSGEFSLVSQTHNSSYTFPVGITVVQYVYQDSAGNTNVCSFAVSITEVDAVPPTVTCPVDMTYQIDLKIPSIFVEWAEPMASDNSGSVYLVANPPSPGLFTPGAYTVEYVYRDVSNNEASCSFSIVVDQVDFTPCTPNPCQYGGVCSNATEPFQFVCECANGYSGKECEVTPCRSNPCLNGGTCNIIENIVSCYCDLQFFGQNCEVDPCDSNPCMFGGSCEHSANGIHCSCAEGFTGTKCNMDTMHPELLYCPENIFAQITSATTEQLSVTWAEPNGTDNSQEPVSVFLATPKGPGSFFSLRSNTSIQYFIIDSSRNAVECSFDVIVEDNAPPIVTYCPGNITRQVMSVTQPGLLVSWNLPEATDLSDENVTVIPAFSSQPTPGSFFSVRSTSIIQYNISDVWNNTAFCSFSITVDLCGCYTNATMQPEADLCVIDNSCNIDAILRDISEVPVDEENVEQVAAVLANATGYFDRIQSDGIVYVAPTMENIAQVASPSTRVTEMVIETVDNILNVNDEMFSSNRSASARILQAFESQLAFPRDNISLARDNIVVEVVRLSPQSYSESLGFASIPENGQIDGTLLNNDEKLYIDSDQIPVVEAEASILIPEEAFTIDIANSTATLPVIFVVYQNAKLFQAPQRKGLDVNSRVISGSLEGIKKTVEKLTDPVVTSFRPLNNTSPTNSDTVCVFWDPTLIAGDSVGNWSTKGCSLAEDKGVGEAKICHCDHLTSFAILISRHGDVMHPALDVLSKIGCGVSIAALILTILITMTSSDLSSTPRKTLLNLCVSLILLYAVFLVGIELIQPRVACIIFAALIHYFFLSSVCWSSAEAMICFYLLVLTRRTIVKGYLLRMMVFCWGIPAMIVFVTLPVPYFVGGQWNVPDQKYCFLSPGNSIYFGVLLPVGALLLFNVFIYILVFRRLVCQRIDSSVTRQERRLDKVLRQARTMIPIGLLLGGTWIFGFLAIGVFTTTFQYIFAILNSLIGLAVFFFFILLRKNGRQGLRNLCCCGSKSPMGSSGARGSHSTSDTRMQLSSNVHSNTT